VIEFIPGRAPECRTQCGCRGQPIPLRIRVLAGNKVLVEMTPYDLSNGRITYRFK
jgi:hypothetical protein